MRTLVGAVWPLLSQIPYPVETEPPFRQHSPGAKGISAHAVIIFRFQSFKERGVPMVSVRLILMTALAAARRGPTASNLLSVARSARDQDHC